MRSIKFRGWDGQQMHRVCYVTDKGIGALGNGGMIIPRNGHLDAIMQFTGMTDINGVEIYEGDIVVSNYNSYTKGPKPVEYWENCGFWPIHDYVDYDGVRTDDWEVIGNIYQNPDLIP